MIMLRAMQIKMAPKMVMGFRIFDRAKTDAGIYVAKPGIGSNYTGTERIFILFTNEKNELCLEKGDECYVSDGFELEQTKNIWDEFQDDPAFAELKQQVEKYDAKPVTVVCNERSLLGVVE